MYCHICNKGPLASATAINGLFTCDWCIPINPNTSIQFNSFPSNSPSLDVLPFINVFKLNEDAFTPERNLPNDAGLDLFAVTNTFIPFEETVKVSTGICAEIKPGYIGQILSRSSLSAKGLEVGAGVIDAGYSGELKVVIHNLTHPHDHDFTFKSGYLIKRGDKIAQLVIQKIETPAVRIVDKLWSSDRGNSGMGSSGR